MSAGPRADAVARVRAVLAAPRPAAPVEAATATHPVVREALAAVADAAARAPDPYWPKWDGPWWTLLLLAELGVAPPPAAVEALAGVAARTWLPAFPRTEDELAATLAALPADAPARDGFDGSRHVVCFCALGGLAAVCRAAGVDLDRALPWWRALVRAHQLPDGGWNCDEAAHVRPAPCSSVVSTAPVLEALLDRLPTLTEAERAALDRGVGYLLARALFRSLRRGGAPIDARWLAPAFPRFYGYDALRGLALAARWARATGAPLPAAAVVDALEALAARAGPDGLPAAHNDLVERATTLRPPTAPGEAWTRGHAAAVPPLLALALRPGAPSPALTRAWRAALDDLAALDAAGRLG